MLKKNTFKNVLSMKVIFQMNSAIKLADKVKSIDAQFYFHITCRKEDRIDNATCRSTFVILL